MMIKKKSLIVAVLSSIIICVVLVLTLVAYLMYLELKDDESRRAYQGLLSKVNARSYAKYIELSGLSAVIETKGPLSELAVLKGVVKNKGTRQIIEILLKVKFLDNDGAVIYEVSFHPQEPALGSSSLSKASLPYLYGSSRATIKSGDSLPFKMILDRCPRAILSELKGQSSAGNAPLKWSGKFEPEILTIDF